MKKQFEAPELNIIYFLSEDIITDSTGEESIPGEDVNDDF